jgi:RHS repeat-associated protein
MFCKWIFCFTLLIQCIYLNAESWNSVTVFEGEPSANICDAVNVITGDFFISEQDIVVPGLEPIQLPRIYLSSHSESERSGWQYPWLSYLEYYGIPDAKFKRCGLAVLTDHNGATLYYSTKTKKGKSYRNHKPGHFHISTRTSQTALTNSGKGDLSGRSNWRNTEITLPKDSDIMYLHFGDGSVRSYSHFKKLDFKTIAFCGLTSITLASGNKIQYIYDKKHNLKEIKTTNPSGKKCYAWAKFKNEENGKKQKESSITTSDGRTYKFHFAQNKSKYTERFLLKTFSHSESPPETYRYELESEHSGPKLARRSFSNSRTLSVNYYSPPYTQVEAHRIKIKNNEDPLCNRVSQLCAPVGADETLLPIYSFFYAPGEPEKKGGWTDVYDAYWNKTTYHYSRHLRLELIQHYQENGGNQTPLYSEKIVWGPQETELEGNLLCKSILDEHSLPLFSHRYHYDNRGNVVTEEVYGNLTGACPSQLTLDSNGLPNVGSSEVYVKRSRYSDDGRNLLLQEDLENGKSTLLSYLPNSDKITSKLILDHGRVAQREFYEYDADNICIKEIIDDGSSDNKNDLTDVTERRVKLITPRPGPDCIGYPEMIEEYYEENGQLVLLQKTAFHYTPQGRIAKKDIYDAHNEFRYSLIITYNAQGKVEDEYNALGQIAHSEYDANGNKILYREYSGNRTLFMTYDFSNRLIRTEEKAWNGPSHITHHRYDCKDNKIATADSFGNETKFKYNALNKIIATQSPEILDPSGNALQPTTSASYDGIGRKISETDANGNTTTTQYNAWGKPIRIMYADGTHESFLYNTDSSLKEASNQEGTRTLYTYDYLGRETSKTITSPSGEILSHQSSRYNAFHLIETQDPEGNLTHYFYDRAGRKIAEEFQSERTEYSYDELGRLNAIKRGTGTNSHVTITERDLLGRVIEERIEDENSYVFSKVLYEYDPAGNIKCLTRFIEDKPSCEYFLYDAFNRPIQQLDAAGYQTKISYNEDYLNSLNQRVLQKTLTDPNGIQTIETYDALGRIVSTKKKNTFGELISSEQMGYDLTGNLTQHISTVFVENKPTNQIKTLREYNALNRLITLIEAADTPEQKITRTTHTLTGQVDQIIKPDEVILKNTYDPLGRCISQSSSDGTISYKFTYNALHQCLISTDTRTNTTTERKYDALGRILEEKLANGLNLRNHYDERGRRTQLHLPDNSSIHYTYDPLYLRQVQRYSVDQNLLYTHSYETFDSSGHLLEENSIANLGSIRYTIDALGRATSLISPHYEHHIEQFDPTGNILRTRNKTPFGVHVHNYAYDDLSQIIEEHSRFPHKHSYDSHYNRLISDTTTGSFNSLNQLISSSQATYTYDLNGNLIHKQESEKQTHYTYDALGRLLTLEVLNETLLAFTYDSHHRRLTKTTALWCDSQWQEQETQLFLYDEEDEIGATDPTGTILQLRILGSTPRAEIGAAIALELHSEIYVPIHDLHGNVLCLISFATQQIAEAYHYSAFKEEAILDSNGKTIPNSQVHNPWRFSSKRIDEESGLVYYGRRFYDPQAGRWITPDPLGYTAGINLYAFVLNNPLIKVDLYGLEALEEQNTWYRNAFEKTFDYSRKFVNFIGHAIYNTFYHGMIIPGIRHVGMAIGSTLAGIKHIPQKSQAFTVGDKNELKNTRTILTTGQLTFEDDSVGQTSILSQALDGEQVTCVYNSTHGLIRDTIESATGKIGINHQTVDLLVKQIRSAIQDLGGTDSSNIIYLIGWSQGGLTIDLARKQLTAAERRMIKVRTLGSASLFDCKDMDVQHYVSSGDPIPWVSLFRRLKASFSNKTNIHVLKRQSKGFLPEHSFVAPTYREQLDKIGDEINKSGKTK